MSFGKHIWTCNHDLNQDIKYFHDPKRFYAPYPSKGQSSFEINYSSPKMFETELLFVIIN